MRKSAAYNDKKEKLMLILTGILSCVGAVSLSALLFSFVISKIDLSDDIIKLMSSISLCVGCIAAGYSVSKRRRKNGLLTGLLCGIIIFFVVLFAGILFVRTFTAMGFISKLIIILVCSAIGGVIGVNSLFRIR